MKTKDCVICGGAFVPSPRHWNQQNTCQNPDCRKERDTRAQEEWVKAHPGYFRGRYVVLKKSWDYRGYLRGYRMKKPGYVVADNLARRQRRRREARSADIQETVARRRETILGIRSRRGADIQETVQLKLDGVLDYLERGGADMQISMASGSGARL
jgi:hypothetical protein